MNKRIDNYKDFWPYYLREHTLPANRALHYIGSTLVLLVLVLGITYEQFFWLWLMPIVGYGFAWFGHFKLEHNKPATFKYPLWSFISDFRMYFLWLSGSLDKELDAAGITSELS
jgi:hypothetical protein